MILLHAKGSDRRDYTWAVQLDATNTCVMGRRAMIQDADRGKYQCLNGGNGDFRACRFGLLIRLNDIFSTLGKDGDLEEASLGGDATTASYRFIGRFDGPRVLGWLKVFSLQEYRSGQRKLCWRDRDDGVWSRRGTSC